MDRINSTTFILCAIIAILVASLAAAFLWMQRQNTRRDNAQQEDYKKLQLQAYERLTLLVDRIALPNLLSRVNVPGASVRDLQMLLTRTIKEEFEYNITQQVYVSTDAWSAVKNLKEQNMLVVNQFANALPPNATGLDLTKVILEYLMYDQKGTLHELVSEVLSYEAKKLLAA
jgi:hypothetical protein